MLDAEQSVPSPDPAQLGHLLAQLGKVRHRAGDLDAAEALYRRALDAYKAASEHDLVGLATAFHGLAVLLEERGDLANAAAFCHMALDIREKLGDGYGPPVRRVAPRPRPHPP